MKKILVLLALFVAIVALMVSAIAQTRTVSWLPVTQYADINNTPIEAANLPMRYDVRAIDNVTGVVIVIASNVTTLSVAFDDSTWVNGRRYDFSARARVQTGAESVWSPPFGWSRPFQAPSHPAGVAVQ